MTTTPKREGRHLLPDVFEWPDLPGLLTWPSQGGQRGIRVEEYLEDGRFVVRAELPGLDPEKDVSVDIDQDTLSIHAERQERSRENGRSEFHYGSFTRTLTLPPGADESKVKARYEAGILEITVPVETKTPQSRSVPIEHTT